MRKIIFVCTGNTCRSPMAEGLFKIYLQKNKIENITVSSCGLGAFSGDEASKNAVRVCADYGVDIQAHRSRSFSPYEITPTTFFVCMTKTHADFLSQYVDPSKLYVLNIMDPYGQDLGTYQQCAEQMICSFPKLVSHFLLDLQIQPMCAGDITALATIEQECFVHPWSVHSLKEELTNPQARFFVAKTSTDTIGYIGATNVLGEVYMANLAVQSKYRKLGVASELLNHLIDISKKEQAEFITLEVRKSNNGAIALYKMFGFEPVGERKNFYTDPLENALLFTKRLK